MPTFATFRGHPDPVKRAEGTPGIIKYCGISFQLGEPVDISGKLTEPQLSKLRTNHNFVLDEQPEAAAEAPPPEKAAKSPAKSASKSPTPTPSSQDAAPAKLPQTPPAAPAAAVEASAATSSAAAGTPATMAKPVRPVGLTKAK